MQKKPNHDPAGIAAQLRRLPSIARLLGSGPFEPVLADHGSALVTDLLRERLARLRGEIQGGALDGQRLALVVAEAALAVAVADDAESLLARRPRLVINATGVVVHTNLGRSLLSEASGALLREVGTTNRTRLADYEAAATAESGMILKVHTSNFRVVGFSEETSVEELASLAGRMGLPLVVDWGSGNLADLEVLGIRDESPVARILEQGADLVTFSGDKLLGGPQAGFVVGRDDLVQRVRKDPLSRVCRLDRLRIGALQQTLAAYVRDTAFEEVPTLRMLALDAAAIAGRAQAVLDEVGRRTGAMVRLELVDGVSRTGGGSSPTGERPTTLLAVSTDGGDSAAIERRLRAGRPAIIGRMSEGRLLLDLRTVLPEQDELVTARLAEALAG